MNRIFVNALVSLSLPVLAGCSILGAEQFQLKVPENSFSFEIYDPGAPVEHTFYLENQGDNVIQIERVRLTPPLKMKKATPKILPHQVGELTISLGTPRKLGDYDGAVEVIFKNKALQSVMFLVEGKITPAIEVRPFPVFFVAASKGQSKTASLEIVNRDQEPLEITRVEHSSSRFVTKIETIEAGQRFRLDLTLRGDAKAGRTTDVITLATSSTKQPEIKIEANTYIKERINTFPENVELGAIRVSDLKAHPELIELLAQTLMVYHEGEKDFKVTAMTDLPFLKVSTEQSELGDRSKIDVSIIPENLTAGPVDGSIGIRTNDPEFPILNVSVKGSVEGVW